MTYLKIPKLIILFLIFFYTSAINANEKIYYINMDYIINNSVAGKSIIEKLNKKRLKNIEKFKKDEEKLKSEEKKIISQKNVLDNDEYKKKIITFRDKISDYNSKKNIEVNRLKETQIKAQALLIESLTPILAEYAKDNSISLILSKKDIIIGKSELDITKPILKILDSKIKNIDIN